MVSDVKHSESATGFAESETLCMRGSSMLENREISEAPHQLVEPAGRSGKVCGRTLDVHVSEKSDINIVPEKASNKTMQSRHGSGDAGGKGDDQGESSRGRL